MMNNQKQTLTQKLLTAESVLVKIGIFGWSILMAVWTKPFWAEYYQSMANSHYDTVQWCQMGPVFVIALCLAVIECKNKRFFTAALLCVLAVWSFYWAFLISFSCFQCTYGG